MPASTVLSPRRTARGFTLTELIVAIVVLGLLAALAIPTQRAVINRTHDEVAKVELAAIAREAAALAALDGQGASLEVDDIEAGTAGANAEAAGQLVLAQSTDTATDEANSGRSVYVRFSGDPIDEQKQRGHRDDLALLPVNTSSEAHGYVSYALNSSATRMMLAQRSRSGKCAVVWGTVGGAMIENVYELAEGLCIATVEDADEPDTEPDPDTPGDPVGDPGPPVISFPDPDGDPPVIFDPDPDADGDPEFPDPLVDSHPPVTTPEPNPALWDVEWVTRSSEGVSYMVVSDRDAGMLYAVADPVGGAAYAIASTSAYGRVLDLGKGTLPAASSPSSSYRFTTVFALTESGDVLALDPFTLQLQDTVLTGLNAPTAFAKYDTAYPGAPRDFRMVVSSADGLQVYDSLSGSLVTTLSTASAVTSARDVAATFRSDTSDIQEMALVVAGDEGVWWMTYDFPTDTATSSLAQSSTVTDVTSMSHSSFGEFWARGTTLRRQDGGVGDSTYDPTVGSTTGGSFQLTAGIDAGFYGDYGAMYVVDYNLGCLVRVTGNGPDVGDREVIWCGSSELVTYEPWQVSTVAGDGTGGYDQGNPGRIGDFTAYATSPTGSELYFKQGNTLRVYDPSTGELSNDRTLVTPSYFSVNDLEFHGGSLYAIGRSCYYSCSPFRLYRIESDGTYTLVMDAVVSSPSAMTSIGSTLYALGSNGQLWRIDPSAPSSTSVATGLPAPRSVNSTAFASSGGTIYYASTRGIEYVDPITGTAVLLHSATTTDHITADEQGGIYFVAGDQVRRVSGDGTSVHMAGVSSSTVRRDGVATDAWFNDIDSLHVVAGRIFAYDTYTLRELTAPAVFDSSTPAYTIGATDTGPAGISVLAGDGTGGFTDGPAGTGRMNQPNASTVAEGLVWFAQGRSIRTLDPNTGELDTVVANAPVGSYTSLVGIARAGGKTYVSGRSCYYSCSNNLLYQVRDDGTAGLLGADIGSSTGPMVSHGGLLYVFSGAQLYEVNPSSVTSRTLLTLPSPPTKMLPHPLGALAVAGNTAYVIDVAELSSTPVASGISYAATGRDGELYVATNQKVLRLRSDGTLEPMAGITSASNPPPRLGVGSDANFDYIRDIWVADGQLLVFDDDHEVVYLVDGPQAFDRSTSTTAASPVAGPVQVTTTFGTGTAGATGANLNYPNGMTEHNGELWFFNSRQLRSYDPSTDTVTDHSVVNGGSYTTYYDLDWIGGDLYAIGRSCYYSCSTDFVHRIDIATGNVATVLSSDTAGDARMLAHDGSLYTVINGRLDRIDPATFEVTTLGSGYGTPIDFEAYGPTGQALLATTTNTYVVDLSDGSSTALNTTVTQLAAGSSGNVFAWQGSRLYEFDPSDGSRTALAGGAANTGTRDGVGTDVTFDSVRDIAVVDGIVAIFDRYYLREATGPVAYPFNVAAISAASVTGPATTSTVAGLADDRAATDGGAGTSRLERTVAMEYDAGLVWMLDATRKLRTFDPSTSTVTTDSTVAFGSYTTGYDLLRVNGKTYVSWRSCYFSCSGYNLSRIESDGSLSSIHGALPSQYVAAANGHFWSANGSTLLRIDPATGDTLSVPFSNGAVTDLARLGNDLLVVAGGDVLQVDTSTLGVTTLATGSYGSVWGTDTGEVYAATNYEVHRIDGSVQLLAGSGSAGQDDGSGSAATFDRISALVTAGGQLFAADSYNYTLRAID